MGVIAVPFFLALTMTIGRSSNFKMHAFLSVDSIVYPSCLEVGVAFLFDFVIIC